MATRQKAAETPAEEVTVNRSVLRQFVNLAEGLEQADNAYKACQASLFRNYAQGAYKAANVRAAVAQAKEALGTKGES